MWLNPVQPMGSTSPLKTMRTIMHTFASCVDYTAVPKFGGIVWAGKFGLKASNDSK